MAQNMGNHYCGNCLEGFVKGYCVASLYRNYLGMGIIWKRKILRVQADIMRTSSVVAAILDSYFRFFPKVLTISSSLESNPKNESHELFVTRDRVIYVYPKLPTNSHNGVV